MRLVNVLRLQVSVHSFGTVLLFVFLLLIGLGGPTAVAQNLEGKHPRLAYKDTSENQIYVSLTGTHEIAVWDAQNDALAEIISLVDDSGNTCENPRSVVYTDPGFIWAACFGSEGVWVVDEDTDDVVEKVEGSFEGSWEMDYSATNDWVAVSNWGGAPGEWDPSQSGDEGGTVALLEADPSDEDFGTMVPESELPEGVPNPIKIPSTEDGGPWGTAACEGIFWITHDGMDATLKLTLDPFALELFDKGELPWEVECRSDPDGPLRIAIANGGDDTPPEGGNESMVVDGPMKDRNGNPVQTSFTKFPGRANSSACWNTIFDSWTDHKKEKYFNHTELSWWNTDNPPSGSDMLTRKRGGVAAFMVVTLFENGECTVDRIPIGSGSDVEPWSEAIGPEGKVYLFDMHTDTVTEFDPSTGGTSEFQNQCYTALRDGVIMEVDGTRKLYTINTGDHDISSQDNGVPADYDYSDAEGPGGLEWWNLDTGTHKGCNALPVELAQFDAVRDGERSVRLVWQTASETNNAGFQVQHRAPGGDTWRKLDFVDSKASGGTASEPLSYRFRVDDLSVGTHRFRLKQKDLDGSTSLTKPATVTLPMRSALRLTSPSPNPVSESATLSFAVKEETRATVTVYNMLGQRVATLYEGTPTAGESRSLHFDVRPLPSGTYLVRLEAGGNTQTQRVTVVR